MSRSPLHDVFAVQLKAVQEYAIGGAIFRMISLPGADHFFMGRKMEVEKERLGDETPPHSRAIVPFALAEYPVTQALWTAVYTQASAQKLEFDQELLCPNPAYFVGPNRPVENVSWIDAHEFCRVLNELLDKPKGYFRLPSEAEWEYAARAGKRETLYAGSNQLNEVGWYDENNEKETMPIGQLAPNAFGMYDLSGNVCEWCEDDWHIDHKDVPPDGRAWVDDSEKRGGSRVRRNGTWISDAWSCGCACRSHGKPDLRRTYLGFRLAAPGLE